MGASCGAGGWSVSVLSIAGEQGSAKTLQSKLLRALIDRSVAPMRALPRDERELFIAAKNGHVLGLRQSQWGARLAVRRAMPGRHRGAFSTRRLFTDHSVLGDATGHPQWHRRHITRADLADRAIQLMLPEITRRRSEDALWREFNLAGPKILGVLDAAAHGLQMLPHVHLKHLPRIADFALWGAAYEGHYRSSGSLERAYSNNRSEGIQTIVDSDQVARRVRVIMADRARWVGTASDLLQVGMNASADASDSPGGPKSPRALAGRLRRVQPYLRPFGLKSSSAGKGGWGRAPST